MKINDKELFRMFTVDHHLLNKKILDHSCLKEKKRKFYDKRDKIVQKIEEKLKNRLDRAEFLNLIKDFSNVYLKEYYEIPMMEDLFKLEKSLLSLDRYRDHSIHQFIVALLMVFFLELDNNLIEGGQIKLRDKKFFQGLRKEEKRDFVCPFIPSKGEILSERCKLSNAFEGLVKIFYELEIPHRQIRKNNYIKFPNLCKEVKFKDYIEFLINYYNLESINLFAFLCGLFHDLGYPIQNWSKSVLQVEKDLKTFRKGAKKTFKQKELLDTIYFFKEEAMKQLFRIRIDKIFDEISFKLLNTHWHQEYEKFCNEIVKYFFPKDKWRDVAKCMIDLYSNPKKKKKGKTYHFRHDILGGALLFIFWQSKKDVLGDHFQSTLFKKIKNYCTYCVRSLNAKCNSDFKTIKTIIKKDRRNTKNKVADILKANSSWQKPWARLNRELSQNTSEKSNRESLLTFIENGPGKNRFTRMFEHWKEMGSMSNVLNDFLDEIVSIIREDKTFKDVFEFFRNSYLDEVMMRVIAAITFHALECGDKDFKNAGSLKGKLDWDTNPLAILLIFCDNIHWWDRYGLGEVGEIKPGLPHMKFEVHEEKKRANSCFEFKITYLFKNLTEKQITNIDHDIEVMIKQFRLFKFENLPFRTHFCIEDKTRKLKSELKLNYGSKIIYKHDFLVYTIIYHFSKILGGIYSRGIIK